LSIWHAPKALYNYKSITFILPTLQTKSSFAST
jgi:hypothetical protein